MTQEEKQQDQVSIRQKEHQAHLERVEFKNSHGLTLVGDLRRADSKAVVIMSHGFTADRHERGLFDKAANAFNKNGYTVLNFDFSGSGESEGQVIKPSAEVKDLRSAVQFIKDKGFSPIALLGVSFGGYVTAKIYPSIAKDIQTVILWAPVVNKKQNPESYFRPEQQKELADTGIMTVKDDAMARKTLYADREFFDVWRSVEPEEILAPIKCPTLLVHGTADELVLPEGSQKGIRYLSPESRLELVDGAGHGRRMGEEGLAQFIQVTNQWLAEHLPL